MFSADSRNCYRVSGDWGVEIARVGVDRIHRIECRGNWMRNSQPLRYQGVSCASACPVDRFSLACGVDGRVDARVPLAPPSQAGFLRGDRVTGSVLSSSLQLMATYRPRRTFERGLVVNHILDEDGRTDYARKSEDGNTRKE